MPVLRPRTLLFALVTAFALSACERDPGDHIENRGGPELEVTGGTAVNDTTPYAPGDDAGP